MTGEKLENFIDGRWTKAAAAEHLPVTNPATGDLLARVPLSSPADVDLAVAAARAAFPAWSATPVAQRCELLFRLADRVRGEAEDLSRLISRENGKSLPDARAEVKRALENIEVACGMPVMAQGSKLIGAAADIDGEVVRLPLGAFGVIAPFNFPLMVPCWFLPYALAAGNTVIVKPSEQTPLSVERLAELTRECGFPGGVLNVVHGDRVAAERIVEHPDVEGVSFVGTTKVCRMVAVRSAETGKRFQAFGSAKNHLVAMPDARLEPMIRNMVSSCFGCAGQRCMASSAIICVGDELHDTVADAFVAAARGLRVADPLDPAVAAEAMVMGPLISEKARRFVLEMIQTGIDEGATLALDGRGTVVPGRERGHFMGPTVFSDVEPGMAIHRTEIFGPVIVILRARSLEEAIGILNEHPYGNGASIYTQSGHHARKFKLEARAGMIGINVGIPAPVASLPFGGMKASLFADIKAQGRAVVDFFTESRVVTERYWPED